MRSDRVAGRIMKNPWEEISLDDYEKHMSLDPVKQLQTRTSLPNGKALSRLDFQKG